MPIGTRSSISMNSATNPMTATASVTHRLLSLDRLADRVVGHQFGMENQPIGAHRDQQHGGDDRRSRRSQIIGQTGMAQVEGLTLSARVSRTLSNSV